MDILKYRLHEFLNKLSHQDYKIAIKTLPEQLKITRQTFHRWQNIKISENSKIPADDLIALARFFGVTAEEMLIEELKELALENDRKKFVQHFGMSK